MVQRTTIKFVTSVKEEFRGINATTLFLSFFFLCKEQKHFFFFFLIICFEKMGNLNLILFH